MTSIRYAIRSETPEDELVRDERGRVINWHTFTPVPQAVAEADVKNGFSAVFTTTGEQASSWAQVYNPCLEEELAKLKPYPSMADMFNVPLNIGDYAVSAFDERSNYVSVCQVVGFTDKQVRVLRGNRIMSRNAAMLVRVHESVITPEPA